MINQDTDAAVQAVLIAISQAPDDRHIPLLRSYLEDQIDRLEQFEIEYHDFIADTVLVASQRMQDLRLEVIEIRLGDLEKPTFNMRDLVIDFAILLSIELAVILAPHMLAASGAATFGGAMGMLFRNRTRSRAVRRTADDFPFEYQQGQISQYAETLRRQEMTVRNSLADLDRETRAASQIVSESKDRLRRAQQDFDSADFRGVDFPSLPGARQASYAPVKAAEAQLKRSQDAVQAAVGKKTKALETANTLRSQAHAADGRADILKKEIVDRDLAQKVADAETFRGNKLKKFWESAAVKDAQQTIHGRIAEEAGAAGQIAWKQDLCGPAIDSLTTEKFSPSEVVASHLAMAREDRRYASIAFARLRNIVRYANEDGFLDNSIIQTLTRTLHAAVSGAGAEMTIIPTLGPIVSKGVEFSLWLFWLANASKLEMKPGSKTLTGSGQEVSYSSKDKAVFVDSILVASRLVSAFETRGPDGPKVGFEIMDSGMVYPMADGFSEHITDYLYKTFTAPYLAKIPSVPIPRLYDDAEKTALAGAFALAKLHYQFFDNAERTRLMKHMAVLNTHAFLHFRDVLAQKLPTQLYANGSKTLGEVCADQPPPADGPGVAKEVIEAQVAEQSDLIVSKSQIIKRHALQDAQNKLLSLVLDAEQKRVIFTILKETDLEDTARVRAAGEALIAAQATVRDVLSAIEASIKQYPEMGPDIDENLIVQAQDIISFRYVESGGMVDDIWDGFDTSNPDD